MKKHKLHTLQSYAGDENKQNKWLFSFLRYPSSNRTYWGLLVAESYMAAYGDSKRKERGRHFPFEDKVLSLQLRHANNMLMWKGQTDEKNPRFRSVSFFRNYCIFRPSKYICIKEAVLLLDLPTVSVSQAKVHLDTASICFSLFHKYR